MIKVNITEKANEDEIINKEKKIKVQMIKKK